MIRFLGWLGCLTMIGAAPAASAQNFPTERELQVSVWDTTYTTPSGDSIPARIRFDGRRGSFDTSFGRGQLSEVEYGVDVTSSPDRPFFQINGTWAFQGDSGPFIFSSQGANRFEGTWYSDQGGQGKWTGRRLVSTPSSRGRGVTYDRKWSFNSQKGYYYKRCTFPAGGYQYIICYPDKPEWIYWYNPVKQVCWCACPTIQHPMWGNAIAKGQDLFLMATVKARDPRDATFPDDTGANFKSDASAKDRDGSDVPLGCPPTDLP